MNEHAPLKKRIIKHHQVPYMNGELRRAMNVKNMFWRKWDRCRSKPNWERFRKHRNLVTTLRKQSLSEYMKGRCNSTQNGKHFWDTVKPLISDKYKGSNDITLMENNTIINDGLDVANIFNSYYVNVTKEIGKPDDLAETDNIDNILESHISDDCIKYIAENITNNESFSFSDVTVDHVYKKLKCINVRKSPGHDKIPPKLLKLGAGILCKPIQSLINMSIRTSSFPNVLKYAEVTPVYKKDDRLNKVNYRPISVLPCMSKIFESVLVEQLSVFFEKLFSSSLSGFRKSHNCQSVLVKFIETCKSTLDRNELYGALLTDLSKAFDCLPHKLLITKLRTYGVDANSCMLIASYFRERKQRVKISNKKSEWLYILKGAAQGSIFGPFAYNVHSKDILFLLMETCDVYNYGDEEVQ